jgi:hypothetical protein
MNKTNMEVTRQELLDVTIPTQTNRYKPVSHGNLINMTLEHIDKAGFVVKKETYTAAQKGLIATAYYDLEYGGDPEVGLRVAWQNSYNKQVSLKYALGLNVFVCTNGCFYGDIGAFKKKHTGIVQEFTPAKIDEYFTSADGVYSNLVQHKNRLKEIELSKKVMAQLIGEMYVTEAILKETQVSIMKREVEKESYDYGVMGTAWNLYNAATHSFKSLHPTDYLETHNKLHNFFVNEFGLIEAPDNVAFELELVN